MAAILNTEQQSLMTGTGRVEGAPVPAEPVRPASDIGADVQRVFASLREEYHELVEQLVAEDPDFSVD